MPFYISENARRWIKRKKINTCFFDETRVFADLWQNKSIGKCMYRKTVGVIFVDVEEAFEAIKSLSTCRF